MRFKVVYVEGGKVKRCFMHIAGLRRFWFAEDEVVPALEGRFRRNEWWGMKVLEIYSAQEI